MPQMCGTVPEAGFTWMQGENGSGAPRISDRASAMASPHEADNELKSLDFPDCPCLDGSMS